MASPCAQPSWLGTCETSIIEPGALGLQVGGSVGFRVMHGTQLLTCSVSKGELKDDLWGFQANQKVQENQSRGCHSGMRGSCRRDGSTAVDDMTNC